MTPSDQPTPKIPKKVKDLVSLTLKLGWKNKKRPFGPTELDLEAGNLVSFLYLRFHILYSNMIHQFSNDSSDQDSVDILVQSPSLDAIDDVLDEEMQIMLLISLKNRHITSLQRGSKNTNMMTLIT